MRRATATARLDLWPVIAAAGLLIVLAAHALAIGGGDEAAHADTLPVGALEERIISRVENVEHDFVTFVEMLEARFASELDRLEAQLRSVLEDLEQTPLDEGKLLRLAAVQRRINRLAAEVDRLNAGTRFLESAAGSQTSRPPT